MSSNQYTKERKEDKPVLAICYDFDKTLSPDDMQAQGYIQSVGYDVGEFWTESNGLASQNDMDQNLAYMLLMKRKRLENSCSRVKTLKTMEQRLAYFPVLRIGLNVSVHMERSTVLLLSTISSHQV